MTRIALQAILLVALLLSIPAGVAHDDTKPTVAILQFGPFVGNSTTIDSILGVLLGQGYITVDEFILVRAGNNLDGENMNIIMGDAGYDFANENLLVEEAINRGATALVTLSSPITEAAVNATQDMEDPPAVIFASVSYPYEAGIAQASCVKPANVTGVVSSTPYGDILPLLLLQDPDIQTVGTVYSASETSGRLGAMEIVAEAEALGLTVLEAAAPAISDLGIAAESLVEKGAEALLIPSDATTISGLPILESVAIENGIPIFHAVAHAVNDGATVSAGQATHATDGGIVGIMLVGLLRGPSGRGRHPHQRYSRATEHRREPGRRGPARGGNRRRPAGARGDNRGGRQTLRPLADRGLGNAAAGGRGPGAGYPTDEGIQRRGHDGDDAARADCGHGGRRWRRSRPAGGHGVCAEPGLHTRDDRRAAGGTGRG